jgi:hypothetical protein
MMSLATITAQLLSEAGVTADDILKEAGVDRQGAIKKLANDLGVDLGSLVGERLTDRGTPVEISDADVAKVREGLSVLNRAFS